MLIATGILHTAVGIFEGRTQLAAMAREGFIDTIDPHPDRQRLLWFLISGAGLVISGQLASWTHRGTGTLPATMGWNLLATSVIGATLLPRSGFWLIIPQGLLIIAGARDRA
jgi:hypothetical protein